MFRLPVCPHCGTVYHYRDTYKIAGKKTAECYHCKKSFKASVFPSVLVLILIWLLLNVSTNVILLSRMHTLNLILLLGITLGYMALAAVFLPFFVRFKKQKEEQKANEKPVTEKKKPIKKIGQNLNKNSTKKKKTKEKRKKK